MRREFFFISQWIFINLTDLLRAGYCLLFVFLEEEEPGLLIEDGVWAAAGVAGHVLLDVPTNNTGSHTPWCT